MNPLSALDLIQVNSKLIELFNYTSKTCLTAILKIIMSIPILFAINPFFIFPLSFLN